MCIRDRPTAPPALPVLHMMSTNALGDQVEIQLDVWDGPEQLIAMVQDGGHQMFAFPLTVVAKLYNKGLDVQLMNVNTWGVTYFLTSDPDFRDWSDLKGKTVYAVSYTHLYPIPAYGVTSDFNWSETEQNRLLFSLASRYGTPYFINYTRSGLVPEDVRISCQETRPDLHVLHRKAGGFFGYGEHTGAIGVVTINLPRIAFQSGSGEEFYERLDHLMDLAARSLDTKRRVVSNLLKNGLYPYTCLLYTSHILSII